ncbi:MAG TPA: ice-binding family protein [Pyrinomonadaceae bacterium]
MLAYALNFKSAAGYQTLAAKSDEVSARTKKELSDTYSAISQLPCTKIDSAQMGGKSFASGVYCFDSAELAGRMALDAENDSTSKFVFLVRGNFSVNSGSGISLENGAQAANVFFVAEDSIRIGEGVDFAGNLIAGNDVDVNDASTVKGRMISVTGKVNGTVQSNLGGDTGSVQICKTVTTAGGTDISNRFYRFTVSGGPAGVIEIFVPPTPAGATTSTGCSGPFDVTAGPQTITEEPLARLSGQSQAMFFNFQLINVEQLNPPPPSPAGASSLGAVNLSTRTAAINVIAGNQTNTLVLRFTNQFAITGFIEICKHAATGPTLGTATFGFAAQTFNSAGDIDVTGTFEFTVEGVYALNRINAPGTSPAVTRAYQVFPVPVGQCSGPIAVTTNTSPPTTTALRESTVRVSELPRTGFFLESVTTRPTFDREVGANPATGAGGEVLGCVITPPTAIVTAPPPPNAPVGTVTCNNSTLGGGFTTVRVIEGSAVSETLVDFFNRSNPGTVKVCKIAGPGIPLGTLFRFSVFGSSGTTGFTAPPATATANSPQFATYGPVSRIVDVQAGDPATGGNCVLVPGLGQGVNRTEFQTFVNGTPVLVVENGISPANTVPVPPGAIRVSRIRVLGPATGTLVLQSGTGAGRAGFTPNQCLGISSTNNCSATNGQATAAANFNASGDITPTPTGFDGRNPGNAVAPALEPRIGRVAFNQRPGEVVAEFTNFLFNPALLKVCKIAAPGLVPGGTFAFTVTLTNGGPVSQPGNVPLFPGNPTGTVSVPSARNEAATPFGNCDFVDGAAFPGGQFNIGSDITIKETGGTAGTIVTSIVSPTSPGGLTADLAARTARLSGPQGVIPGVNLVAFTNALGNGQNPPPRTKFDFDGDGKADPSVITASTGTWSYAASSANYEIRSSRWGVSSDKFVPADYDGDGKYDVAVFRSGTWYIMGSAGAFRGEAFGSPGDIPQPGDYDGDGKDDLAVFRPSNGTWYMQGSRSGFSGVQFGVTTDRPVAADYDGDGKTDQAVYRNGSWYMNKSRDGFSGVNWGLATDIPVPADYTGDGKTDIAVYRNGNWYILNDNGTFTAINWGIATDIPVPADYDGDGKTDVAVYRSGIWYVWTSQGFLAIQLGNELTIPITGRQQPAIGN